MAELIMQEEASTPTTPSSGKWKAYFKADGLYIKNDAGNEIGPLGTGDAGGGTDYIGQKRLSLESGVRVSTTDQTAKTTVYWTDGNTNLSVSVPATTNTPFDVFYSIAGNSLSTVNWTNDTTRATALAVDATLGMLVKSGDADKLYLGTGRTTGSSGQCEDSDAKRFVYNYYNRLQRRAFKYATGTHTYTTAAWRYWNNDTGNKTEFIIGVIEDSITLQAQGDLDPSSAGVVGILAAALNTMSGAGQPVFRNDNAETVVAATLGMGFPSLGYNYLALLEYSSGATMSYNFGQVAAILSM